MELGLEGRTVLVTGASRGIGRAIAVGLLREGASVMLTARGTEELQKTTDELVAQGHKAACAALDVATPEGASRAVAETVKAFGRIDALVNNVGGSLGTGRFDQVDTAGWAKVMDANLMSAVWCSQAAVEQMKAQQGGVIVHINSICGREYCTSAPYTAAKAALTGLTKEMAIDLARYRIRVNSVAPGSILFPGGSWDRRRLSQPERIEKMLKDELPWGRFGAPEEVAHAVVFLCSDRASWISGATLPVDGAQGRAF